MKKINIAEINKIIAEDALAKAICRWQPIGLCGIDAGMLLVHDPCYTLPKGDEPEFTYGDCCKVGAKPGSIDAAQLMFKRGHPGAGVVVHSPHGDGTIQVWAKLDAKNRVRAVFFSFDDERPPTDCPHHAEGTISEEAKGQP